MSGMKLSDTQRRVMRHALGYDHPKIKPGWRNRYVCAPDCLAGEAWLDLVARGLAEDGGELNNSRGSHFFYVTDAGKETLEASQ